MEADAMFEYIAMEDDELTLKVGDVITDIKKHDEGWYEGFLRGRRGVFPDNFVQIRAVSEIPKAVPPLEIPKAVLPSEIPKAVLPEMRDQFGVKLNCIPLPPVGAGMESKVKVRRAKVTYSYTAENPDELNLAPGQIVDIITEEEAGWWKGAQGGKVGVFPSNFVEEVMEEPKPGADTKLPFAPEPVKFPLVDAVKLPISVAPVSISEKPPIVPQDTRNDETDLPLDLPKIRVMPGMFDPSKVKLKPPPPSADLRFKPTKAPEKAKGPEEQDVKVGETVDVIRKDAVSEVLSGDKSSAIPDNAAEIIIPGKKPLPKEPPKLPFKKAAVADPPKVVIQPEHEPPSDLTESFGVPRTIPLDTTAVQTRPKHMGRPPSSAKLPVVEVPVESTPAAPWQEEMKKRVVKPPHPPPPAAAAAPPAALSIPSPSVSTGPPAAPPKPKLPAPKVDAKAPPQPVLPQPAPPQPVLPQPAPPQPALSSDKLVEKLEQDKSQDKLVTNSPVPSDNALKDVMEKIDKLSEAFEKFKTEMVDKFEKQRIQNRKDIDTLTRDLDEERKRHAASQIEVDRLKKSVADIRDKY